jgi:hypothetical protein
MVTARRKPEIISASCWLTDQVGQAVYIRDQANGAYKVRRCNPRDPTSMPAVGVIIAKWNSTKCLVQIWGEVKGLYTGLLPRKTYSVSTDGRPVHPPEGPIPGGTFLHQNLGVALDVNVLLLNPSVDPTIRVG